jgi:hypothetical protein
MRTTVRLEDHLLAAAKQRASERGSTLTSVIEDALRESLLREAPRPDERVALPRFGQGGLLPGVDLSNNEALRDIMDDECF